MNKIQIFDNPLVVTQRFELSFPGEKGRVTVIRKKVTRQLHHMGCTDGLKEGHQDISVDYEIYREVSLEVRSKAIEEIEKMLGEDI